MNKNLFNGFFILLLSVMSLGFVLTTQAETLPPGFLIGDDTGFRSGTDGQYFINNSNIEPGSKFNREISISNYSNSKNDFSLNLVMNPYDDIRKASVEGEINLLEAIEVKLTYQDKVIYQGPIDGNGSPIANNKNKPISLGTIKAGELHTIQAEFVVSNEYPKEDWKNINSTDFYWLFYISKEVDSPSKKKDRLLPNTGEELLNLLLLSLSVLILAGMTYIYKEKNED